MKKELPSYLVASAVGVWGYGMTGKSVVRFLLDRGIKPVILDQRELTSAEAEYFSEHGLTYMRNESEFLDRCDTIIPSPGIDIRDHVFSFGHKFVSELDLFAHYFAKKTIAVVGTLGKTTVATLAQRALKSAGIKAALAGNIGVGMIDLIEQQERYDCVVLELSSFQLEHIKKFIPSVVLWTNFYSNHLDRHGNITDYLKAKSQAIRDSKTNLLFVNKALGITLNQDPIVIDHHIELPDTGMKENWQLVASLLLHEGVSALETQRILLSLGTDKSAIEHRMEVFASFNQITVYNDSKSTIPEATSAALSKLDARSTILIIGGLSKGVCRRDFVYSLSEVKKIICYGDESSQLYDWGKELGYHIDNCKSLDEVILSALASAEPHDTILFSPSGASFDLYKNYEERGRIFKELFAKYLGTQCKRSCG